jgi:hypothetical protein
MGLKSNARKPCDDRAYAYSAEVLVNMIGPEGGQASVDRTVEAIGELCKK